MNFLRYVCATAITCFSLSLFSQEPVQPKPDFKRLHYLSEEEMLLPVKTNVDFTETPPPIGPVRMVAEFEPMQAVLIRYTFGIPYSLIREMAEDIEVVTLVANNSQANSVRNLYVANNVDTSHCSFLIAPTDSYWTRDYGPWFVFDGQNQPGIVDFPYNRPRPNDNNVPPKVAQYLNINLFGMNVTHTGGNMMADGLGMAASTELVYEENSQTNAQVNEKMLNYLGINRYDVMNDPLGDYIKHVDCWGKYLAPDKILLGRVPVSDPRYADFEAVADYFETTPSAYGYPYRVYRVLTPGGNPATPYTNSLILNNKVFVPQTGSQHDAAALAVYAEAMPGYEIVPVPYSGWLDTDALHCRTHEIADVGMLFMDHRPVYGEVSGYDSIQISTKIIAHSGQELVTDSLRLFYRLNGGEFMQAPLQQSSDNIFSAYIKNYQESDTVSYFLAAADASGRSMRHPYMAALDPHRFTIGTLPVSQLVFSPDTVLFQQEYNNGFVVYNHTSGIFLIDSLTTTCNHLYPLQLPELPIQMAPGDSLVVPLELIPGVLSYNPQTFVFDSVVVHASIGSRAVILKINFDLISGDPILFNPSVKAVPNPFTDFVAFSIAGLSGTSAATAVLQVYDAGGKLVADRRFSGLSVTEKIVWDGCSDAGLRQPAGVYFYKLYHGNMLVQGKLIKQRD